MPAVGTPGARTGASVVLPDTLPFTAEPISAIIGADNVAESPPVQESPQLTRAPMTLAETSRAVLAPWFALWLVFAAVAPVCAQDDILAGPAPQQTASNSDSFTDWMTESRFRGWLTQQTEAGSYPIAIEGKNVDGLVFYHAKFSRQPAEKYFRFQAFHGIASREYEQTAANLRRDCYREIHTHSFIDPQGDELHCGVWTITFPMLVRTLATSQDDIERVRIVSTLQRLGKDDVEVQGVLLRTLKRCESERVRQTVATNLKHIFVEPARSAAALVAAWQLDSSEQVRMAAISSVGHFPDQAALSVPLLIDALESDKPAMRSTAVYALANIYQKVGILDHLPVDRTDPQQTITILTRLLKTSVPALNLSEFQELQPVPLPIEVEALVKAPGKPPIKARVNGAVRIVMLKQVNERVSDPTKHLRAGVIQDLARLEAAATSALPQILEALQRDPSATVRSAAATALSKIAPQQPDVISALTRAMEHDQPCRVSCVRALRTAGPAAKDCRSAALRLLENNGNRTLRGELIELLAIVGVGSPEVTAKLLDIYTTDAKLTMRARAAIALAAVDPSITVAGHCPTDDCFRQAKEQLALSHQFAKAEAARAMGILGPLAHSAVPDLIKATTHYSFSVQSAAVTSLSQMGPAAREAVPAIAALLQEDAWRLIPPVAAEALGNMGPLATDAIPALQACLEAPHPGLREAAAAALRKITDGT